MSLISHYGHASVTEKMRDVNKTFGLIFVMLHVL